MPTNHIGPRRIHGFNLSADEMRPRDLARPRRIDAALLTPADVGRLVSITVEHQGQGAQGSVEAVVVTGPLRWYTVTSETIVLAIEDDEDVGAIEWELPHRGTVVLLPAAGK